MSESNHSSVWGFPCGFKAPKAQVVFFVQITAALIIIITAIINLSVPNLCTSIEDRNYWKISLSATVGYLFPSPSLVLKRTST